jgi:P-aminobenzoate N-oxygenase AurF
MATYSYSACLETAHKINWRIADVLGERRFDPARRWMPHALSAAPGLGFLSEHEKRALTQVELAAYAHLFGYVEEFIAPTVGTLARELAFTDRAAFDALTHFAAEEVKHMTLFRAVRDRVNRQLGFELALLDRETETARFVIAKNRGAVLLLTAAIEWMTQRHYVDSIKDDAGLDGLTQRIFEAHWLEESQHAKLDHLETLRAFAAMTASEKDAAVRDLIELVAAVHGLLEQQVEHDIANLARVLGRAFDAHQQDELRRAIVQAKRWTFLLSGVTHPRFEELLVEVTTPEQRERIGAALQGLLAPEPAMAGRG